MDRIPAYRKIAPRRLTSLTGAAFLLAAALCSSNASASGFTGPVTKLNFSTGATAARVSIYVGPHSSPCSAFPDWFSFENADSGLGKIWVAALLAAHASGKPVLITGTGTCDSYGVEIVQFIQVE